MTFRKFLVLSLLFLVLWAATDVAAQNTKAPALAGRVQDAESRTTLPGATLVLSRDGAQIVGEISNSAGTYAFPDLSPNTYILTTSFIGYETRVDTLELPRTKTFDVLLQPTRTFLEEVLVETQRADENRFVAGLSIIRPGDLSRVPMPDVSYDLAGYLVTLPGVVSTGDRGGQLFIRGGTPTQNLVLVDGMRVFQPFHIV